MSFITDLFSGGAGKLVDSIGNAIDKNVTSDEERLELELAMNKAEQDFSFKSSKLVADQNLGQMEILKVDAASKNWFQASWRPMIGWVGALAMAWNFIVHPLLTWGLAFYDPSLTPPPLTDTSQLFPIILGMLGIAGMRSYDKRNKTDTRKNAK